MATDIYLVWQDNGYEFDSPSHSEWIAGIFTEERYAMLFLYDNGFEGQPGTYYWNGPQCAWVERRKLHDTYVHMGDH